MALFSPDDLTCLICLCVFDDPVVVSCGHSFCRKCISPLSSLHQCPQCRATFPRDWSCFITNQCLKSLAEKLKEARNDKEGDGWFCQEHEEKLKLFCVTDQQLVCLICRDAEKHKNHQIKPINEAAVSVRKRFETFEQGISKKNIVVEKNTNTQRGEITTAKEKSRQLMNEISEQFEEMHRFLRKKEDELKNELKHKENEDVKKMSESLNALEAALSEGKELHKKVASVLQITDPGKFLKICTDKTIMASVFSFNPEETNPQALQSSLTMGPYESHLQFFVWKQMLQIIKSRAERLSFTSQDLKVSVDGQSLLPACQPCKDAIAEQYQYSYYQPQIDDKKCTAHISVRQYGEIDVGTRNYWKIEIGCYALTLENNRYTISGPKGSNYQKFKDRPNKIGIYQKYSPYELSFYDADNMKLIDTFTLKEAISSSVSVTIFNHTDEVPVRTCCY